MLRVDVDPIQNRETERKVTESSKLIRKLVIARCLHRCWTWKVTTPPSQFTHLISFSKSPSVGYADDTQLFFSFHPLDVHSSTTYLHGALRQISSWMTSNLLTLISSKILFIGLKQQLAKPQNISLNTTHSARNLRFIFDENLTFSDQISSLCRSCYYHISQLRCIRPYLDFKTANTIATSNVHSKLDYCNSLYLTFL